MIALLAALALADEPVAPADPHWTTPIEDDARFAPQRFQFSISMGVRKGNDALRDQLNAVLSRRKADIDRILDGYGIPRVPAPAASAAAAQNSHPVEQAEQRP